MHTPSILAAGALLLTVVGCRDQAASPTEPVTTPEAKVAGATALAFRQVSTGYGHACGVTTNDQAYCWGDAREGQLGNGDTSGPETCRIEGLEFACSTRPVRVLGGLSFRQVSAGSYHTCGVTTDNRAFCWGSSFGGLGDGTDTGRDAPVPVAGGLRFRQVSAGSSMTCGVTTDDRAFCWGQNYHGQLGDGTGEGRLTPTAVAGARRWRRVDAGLGHVCGVTTDSRAFCWGFNRFGQVGDSTEVRRRFLPRLVAGGREFLYVEAGTRHSCGVTTGHRAFCWGDGREGQLGNGKTYLSFWPRRVAGELSFERVTAGSLESCGVTTGNQVYCWGYNGWGELGDGTQERRLTPTPVTGDLRFAQMSAGNFFICAVSTEAGGYCWGSNVFGELGIGTNDEFAHPVPAPILGPI